MNGVKFSVALSMQVSLARNSLRTLSGSFIPRCPDFPHYPKVRAIIRQNSLQRLVYNYSITWQEIYLLANPVIPMRGG